MQLTQSNVQKWSSVTRPFSASSVGGVSVLTHSSVFGSAGAATRAFMASSDPRAAIMRQGSAANQPLDAGARELDDALEIARLPVVRIGDFIGRLQARERQEQRRTSLVLGRTAARERTQVHAIHR